MTPGHRFYILEVMSPAGTDMTTPIRLVAATEADLEQVLLLQQRAFAGQATIYKDRNLPPLTQTLDDLRREFTEKTVFKVVRDGRVIASVRCRVRDRVLFIEKLVVDPDLQNRGIGTAVMQALEKRYADAVDRYALFTGHKSARNLHLYRKLGYRETGRKPLNENCDLIFMEKASR